MKYTTAIALAMATATTVQASPIKRDQYIACDALTLPTYRLKDAQAAQHPHAAAQAVGTIATEGLIGTDVNHVFYELYQDNPDLATHFYVQQCNSTALNLNAASMLGDVPVKLVYRDDTSLCASAESISQGAATSTPLQLKPCLAEDTLQQAAQFWALDTNGTTLSFIGNYQDDSRDFWSSETGGGNTYRTPNVMANPCAYDDENCRLGAISWERVLDA